MFITRTKLFGFITAVAVLAGVTGAAATHTFGDVPDDQYYSGAVAWAVDNDLTTGTGPDTFSPERSMTRAEGFTVIHRYDTNVVQPALAGVMAALGGMNFSPIQVYIDAGETITIAELDGVHIDVDCIDAGVGGVDLSISATGDREGWYFAWADTVRFGPGTDFFIAPGEYGPHTGEFANYEIDGFSIITVGGAYMAIDGETTTYVLNSPVHDADCVYYGMLQWAEAAA